MNETPPNPQSGPGPAPAETLDRRRFFQRVSLLVGGATAIGLGAPIAAFILAPLARPEPRVWRTVGRVDEFKVGQTVDVRYDDASPLPWAGVTARTAAWLRRETPERFVAFSIHCSHLGCPVRWLPDANLFLCPCHGGVFYQNGDVAAGPPGRPLSRYPVRLVNGTVQIETSPLPILTK